MMEPEGTLLEIRDLKTHFSLRRGTVKAVDGVSLKIPRGKTIGLVGESGCGKSVLALSIMRLLQSPPGRIVDGQILLHRQDGSPPVDLARLPAKESAMRRIRGAEITMVFQEPMTSLNPLHTIGGQISEAIRLHQGLSRGAALERAEAMLAKVHISEPGQRIRQYPHQLSGGMRQRVMMALALCCNPSLLIADEPTTALDVTVQAQIMDLMSELQSEVGAAILLITHDLSVVATMAEEVLIMYMGKIVERAPVRVLFRRPLHPYTQGLLNSVPVIGRKRKTLQAIPGMVPSPTLQIRGCAFADRCPHVEPVCRQEHPSVEAVDGEHEVACWLHRPGSVESGVGMAGGREA